VFSPRPARIVAEIRINLPRPRSAEVRFDAVFDQRAKEIFDLIHKSNLIHKSTGKVAP
jgi:NitT/TauT family transport system ATP-binding protein